VTDNHKGVRSKKIKITLLVVIVCLFIFSIFYPRFVSWNEIHPLLPLVRINEPSVDHFIRNRNYLQAVNSAQTQDGITVSLDFVRLHNNRVEIFFTVGSSFVGSVARGNPSFGDCNTYGWPENFDSFTVVEGRARRLRHIAIDFVGNIPDCFVFSYTIATRSGENLVF